MNTYSYNGGCGQPIIFGESETISNSGDGTVCSPLILEAELSQASGNILYINDDGLYASGGTGSGTVSSVGLNAPSFILTVSGSPITSEGTLQLSLVNAGAYYIWGNNTNATGTPNYFLPSASVLNTWFGGTIQPVISLTTTGSSGAATFADNVLNIPQYSGGGGGSQSLDQVLAVGNTSDHSILLGLSQAFDSSLVVSGFGTSVMEGSGATTQAQCWFNLAVARMNYTANNAGEGGFALQGPAGSSIPSFLNTYMSLIPAKDATHNYLVFSWGENDSNAQNQYYPMFDYSTANFITDYHTVLDYAISLGWTADEIIIVSSVDQSTDRATREIQDDYFAASQTVAASYGMLFIDFYHPTQPLFPYYTFDNSVHPSNYGYEILSNIFLQAINSSLVVKTNSQLIGVNGFSEFQSIKLRSALPPTDESQLVSLQSDGTLGAYPSDAFVKIGSGSVIQYGNITIGGQGTFGSDVVSTGVLWSGGSNFNVASNNGAVLGMYEGLVYLDGYESGGQISFQIAPFGQGGSINGFLNSGTHAPGVVTQLYGGTYIQSKLVLDAGTISSEIPYEINTDGNHIYWQDSTGFAHQLDQQSVFDGPIYPAQYSTTDKLALSVTAGAQVYDSTLNQMSYYNGSAWVNL